jgi:hypothetical protein
LTTDWRQLSRDAGLPRSGDGLLIRFPDERKQQVFVEETADGLALRVWSVAGRPSAVTASGLADENVHLKAWVRNRSSDLVGFKVDGRGRLIGEAWVPVAGLDADEWRVYVTAVAQTCDRTEYLLSGRDEA